MSTKDNILEELATLNSTLDTRALTPYKVPAGYFEGLTEQVLRRVKALEAEPAEELKHLSPYLSKLPRVMPYVVPEKYFDELDTNFVMVDESRELETISPLLGSLKKEMPFTVPAGYFENITGPVQHTAKVVGFKWIRYAAAAVVTGLIVLAAFMFRTEKEPGMKVLAKVTRDVKKMNEVQKDNLLDFIDAGMSGEETVRVSPGTRSEIKTLIQGVSEEELRDFQEQTEDLQDVLMTN